MRRLAFLSMFLLVVFAAPSLFAYCEDCPDGTNCIAMDGFARFCEFDPDGSCIGVGTCPVLASASLQSEYRVAAVRVKVPGGKALPDPQPKTALLAAK
jgi:hypothetical protein